MIAKNLIYPDFPKLKTSDTGLLAIELMSEYKVFHLPIINNRHYLGTISEEDIHNLNNPQEPVGNHKISITNGYVEEYHHIYDVIKLMSLNKLSTVGVINKSNIYIGTITIHSIFSKLHTIAAINEPGGIIILELNNNDLYFSEIAQIIESNDSKILSLYVFPISNSTKIEVTLKINKIDILPVIQTLLRYNYNIKASYLDNNNYNDMIDRYNLLLKYLNI